MVIVPLSKPENDSPATPEQVESESMNWIGFAAGGTLVTAGLLLLAGERRASRRRCTPGGMRCPTISTRCRTSSPRCRIRSTRSPRAARICAACWLARAPRLRAPLTRGGALALKGRGSGKLPCQGLFSIPLVPQFLSSLVSHSLVPWRPLRVS